MIPVFFLCFYSNTHRFKPDRRSICWISVVLWSILEPQSPETKASNNNGKTTIQECDLKNQYGMVVWGQWLNNKSCWKSIAMKLLGYIFGYEALELSDSWAMEWEPCRLSTSFWATVPYYHPHIGFSNSKCDVSSLCISIRTSSPCQASSDFWSYETSIWRVFWILKRNLKDRAGSDPRQKLHQTKLKFEPCRFPHRPGCMSYNFFE